MEMLIGKGLRIRSVAANTVLDWGAGRLHGWQAHGGNNQMVNLWTPSHKLFLILIFLSGPSSVHSMATMLKTQLRVITLLLNGLFQTGVCYILQRG
jgi:hypothetical protein